MKYDFRFRLHGTFTSTLADIIFRGIIIIVDIQRETDPLVDLVGFYYGYRLEDVKKFRTILLYSKALQ